MIGETISHYRVTGKLGEGGMGVVYRATDLKLDRDVALKLLSSHLASDTDAQSRFLREAKAAAALDHSNICMVYEVDEVDGRALLAMQLIEGTTVKAKIAERPLKLDEALDIAIQTARGLQAAHEKGVVHRDIKSANLMVTADGQIKIMDFGLARLADHSQITKTATILGTPAYMSPEQAQGQPADQRSDIFSLGVVLYEMVTGRLPFGGENDQSVLYAIINQGPEPPTALRTGLPTDLDRIILKALAKDPGERYQHVDEMGADLNGLRRRHESVASVSVSATRSDRSLSLAKVAALMAAVAVVSGLLAWWMAQSRPEAPEQAGQQVFTSLTTDTGLTFQPALSPDGEFVAYASDRGGEGNLDIWLQQIGSSSPIQLTNDPAGDNQPSFSPDGRTIVFRSERDGGGIYVLPTLGGDARLIAQEGHRPRISPDGSYIAFDRGLAGIASKLYIVPTSGGEPRTIQPEFVRADHPVWLPDGRLLFAGTPGVGGRGSWDWWITPIDGGDAVRTGVRDRLREAGIRGSNAPWDWSEADNSVIFAASQGDSLNIWRIRIEPETGRVDGKPERVTFGPGPHAKPTLSSNGRLAFASGARNPDIWSLPLEANQGRVIGGLERLTDSAVRNVAPSASTDGKRITFVSIRFNRQGSAEVRTKSLPDGRERVLASGAYPLISPDGFRVAFISSSGAGDNLSRLSVMSTSGGIAEEVADDVYSAWGWSHDGGYLLCNQVVGSTPSIVLLDLESRQQTKLLSHPDGAVFQGKFSPDDRWIAFESLGAVNGLYVVPFRGAASISPDDWVRVSGGPASSAKPRWSPDGNLLYFTSNRDGRPCVYAQQLDPISKQPVGAVLDVYHSHDARVSIRNSGMSEGDIDVARDKLILTMAEGTGNIWMMEPKAE